MPPTSPPAPWTRAPRPILLANYVKGFGGKRVNVFVDVDDEYLAGELAAGRLPVFRTRLEPVE